MKYSNDLNNNKTTDLLKYYISKKKSNNILDSSHIKKLFQEYKELQFKNINTKYSDISEGEQIIEIDDNKSLDNEDD